MRRSSHSNVDADFIHVDSIYVDSIYADSARGRLCFTDRGIVCEQSVAVE